MSLKIKMGAMGRDRITGFEGRVIGRCEYISGCNQLLLAPEVDPNTKSMRESHWIDEQRIEPTGSGGVIALDNGSTPGFDKAPPRR